MGDLERLVAAHPISAYSNVLNLVYPNVLISAGRLLGSALERTGSGLGTLSVASSAALRPQMGECSAIRQSGSGRLTERFGRAYVLTFTQPTCRSRLLLVTTSITNQRLWLALGNNIPSTSNTTKRLWSVLGSSWSCSW